MRKSVLNIIMTVVALAVLTGCSGDKAQRLQQLEQQNRSGEPMKNDSLKTCQERRKTRKMPYHG